MNKLFLSLKRLQVKVILLFLYKVDTILERWYHKTRVLELAVHQAEYKAKTTVKVDVGAILNSMLETDSAGDLMPNLVSNPEGQQPDGPAPRQEDNNEGN